MRKLTVLLAVMMLMVSGMLFADNGKATESAAPDTTVSKARIELSETMFDYGFVPEGHRVAHFFTIKSVGEEPLLISRVRTTCGCTSAPLKNDSLAPGESTELKVIFRSSGYRNRKFQKSAIITSNDSNKSSVRVSFKGFTDSTKCATLKATPQFVDMGYQDNFQTENKFLLTNIGQSAIEIKVIDFTKDGIDDVEIDKSKLKPGKSTTVNITLVKSLDPKQKLYDSITFEATDKDGGVERITVPVQGGGPKSAGRHKRPSHLPASQQNKK